MEQLTVQCRCETAGSHSGTDNTEPSKSQWSLYVPHSGHYMYQQFNIQQFYFQPTQCIYVFCVDLRTKSHYFAIQY